MKNHSLNLYSVLNITIDETKNKVNNTICHSYEETVFDHAVFFRCHEVLQRPNSSALKTGRRKVLGLNPRCTCRPNC